MRANRMFFQDFNRDNVQRAFMRGLDIDLWSTAFVMGLKKPAGAKAPGITGVQPDEPVFRPRRRKIISDIFLIGQKFGGHNRADRMTSVIFRSSIATPIAEKTGYRLG